VKQPVSRGAFLLAATVAALALLPSCQGGAGRRGRGDSSGGAAQDGTGTQGSGTGHQGNAGRQGGGSRGGVVSLTDQDLAPMDAWIRRRFWILGDDVEIVASKEYFIQNLSIAARIGLVQRRDEEGPDEARSVLTYVGNPAALDVQTAPRVMIGTGVTITARRTLTIRFVRTTNPDLPVRVRIAANGSASLGTGDQVTRREPTIVVGAQIRRGPDGAYRFEEG
jgi:hypothetical protein